MALALFSPRDAALMGSSLHDFTSLHLPRGGQCAGASHWPSPEPLALVFSEPLSAV